MTRAAFETSRRLSVTQWFSRNSEASSGPRFAAQENCPGRRNRNGVSITHWKAGSSHGYGVPPPWFSISTTSRCPESIIWPSVGHRWSVLGV